MVWSFLKFIDRSIERCKELKMSLFRLIPHFVQMRHIWLSRVKPTVLHRWIIYQRLFEVAESFITAWVLHASSLYSFRKDGNLWNQVHNQVVC